MKIINEQVKVTNVVMSLDMAIKLYRKTFGIQESKDGEGDSEIELLLGLAGTNLVEICPAIKATNENKFINDVRIGDKLTLVDKINVCADMKDYLQTVIDYVSVLEARYNHDLEESKKVKP